MNRTSRNINTSHYLPAPNFSCWFQNVHLPIGIVLNSSLLFCIYIFSQSLMSGITVLVNFFVACLLFFHLVCHTFRIYSPTWDLCIRPLPTVKKILCYFGIYICNVFIIMFLYSAPVPL